MVLLLWREARNKLAFLWYLALHAETIVLLLDGRTPAHYLPWASVGRARFVDDIFRISWELSCIIMLGIIDIGEPPIVVPNSLGELCTPYVVCFPLTSRAVSSQHGVRLFCS